MNKIDWINATKYNGGIYQCSIQYSRASFFFAKIGSPRNSSAAPIQEDSVPARTSSLRMPWGGEAFTGSLP